MGVSQAQTLFTNSQLLAALGSAAAAATEAIAPLGGAAAEAIAAGFAVLSGPVGLAILGGAIIGAGIAVAGVEIYEKYHDSKPNAAAAAIAGVGMGMILAQKKSEDGLTGSPSNPIKQCGEGSDPKEDEKNEEHIDFDNPSTVEGKDPADIKKAIPKDWPEAEAKSGRGRRFSDPAHKGDQIRVMDGNPADPNPVKRGPYIRISKSGKVSNPIPLKGNPTLGGSGP